VHSGSEEADALKTEIVKYKEGWFTAACPGDLVVRLLSSARTVSEPLRLEIEIYNICQGCSVAIPEKATVVIGDYGVERRHFAQFATQLSSEITCPGSAIVNVELKPKTSSNKIANLPAKLEVMILDPHGNQHPWGSAIVDFPYHAYRPVFWTGKRRYNFLAIGFPGAGKTTYITSLSSALSVSNDQRLPRDIGQGRGHNTKAITKYDLSSLLDDASIGVNFWDTWGICEGETCQFRDFLEEFLQNLTDGKVPDGFHLKEYDAQKGIFNEMGGHQMFLEAHRMHGVLFFMRYEHSVREPEKSLAKKYVAKISELGYSTMVVLTWLQKACEKNNTLACKTERVAKVSKALDVPPSTIFPFTRGSVTLLGYKDSTVSMYGLKILQTAMDNADQFSRSMELAHQKSIRERAEKEAQEQADRKEAQKMVGTGPQWGDSVHAALAEVSVLWNFSPEGQVLVRSAGCSTAILVFFVCSWKFGALRVSVGDVPEWRRREVHVDLWLRVLVGLLVLCSLAIAVLPGARSSMIPSQWEMHSSRDCSSESLLLQAPKHGKPSEADCRAQCDARWDCSFASWSSSSCSLYSQCLQVSKSQFKLFQKSSDARWQLGPLLISNLLSLLFPSMSGLAMCLVLASAGWSLVTSGLEFGVAAALSATSLILQFAGNQQLQERKMHVQKDESAKNVRQREIEQKLWKEVRSWGKTAMRKSRQAVLADLLISLIILGILSLLIINGAFAASGRNSYNLLNIVSQLLVGVDVNAGMRALWLVLGVCMSAKPCILAIHKFERGFRGLAHNPLDEIVSAMESVADRAWEIEQLLDQEAENAAVEDGKSSALAVKGTPNAAVKAGLLNKAKHHLQAYASRLQSDPSTAFDRDDLLTELAKATEDAGSAMGGAAVDICKKVAFAVSGGWIGVGAAVGATVASHGRASSSAEASAATESLALVEDGDGVQRRATKGQRRRHAPPAVRNIDLTLRDRRTCYADGHTDRRQKDDRRYAEGQPDRSQKDKRSDAAF